MDKSENRVFKVKIVYINIFLASSTHLSCRMGVYIVSCDNQCGVLSYTLSKKTNDAENAFCLMTGKLMQTNICP